VDNSGIVWEGMTEMTVQTKAPESQLRTWCWRQGARQIMQARRR